VSLTKSKQTIKYHSLLVEVYVPYLNLCIPSFDRYPQGQVCFGFLRNKHDSRISDAYFVVILRTAALALAAAAAVVPLVLATVLVLVIFIGICKQYNCGFVYSKLIKLPVKMAVFSRCGRLHRSRWPRSLKRVSAAFHLLGF
jgi:hypothetical protein